MNMALSLSIRDDGKEPHDLVVLQVPGKRFGQTERDPGDGIDHRYPLLIHEIVEEETYRLQVARDCLRGSSLPEEMIHVDSYILAGHLGKGYRKPSHEVIDDVHVVLHRMGRVVFSLQSSPVPDQLSSLHRSLLFR